MTVKELFTKGPLKGFKALSMTTLGQMTGKTVAVDFSVKLYPWCMLEDYAIAVTSSPRYDSQLLEDQIYRFDEALNKVFSSVVYVYKGKDLPLKRATKIERERKVLERKKKLDGLMAKHNTGQKLTVAELNEVRRHHRGISGPDEIAYGKAIRYMKSRGMNVFGAPGEAEHQLVELQKSKLVDVILTTNADLIPLGADNIIYDVQIDSAAPEKSKISWYRREVVFSPQTNFPAMNVFKEHLPEVANCYGTDYSSRVPNCGPAKIDPFMKGYIESNSEEERRTMLLGWEAKGVIQGPANAVWQLREDYVTADNQRDFIGFLDDATKKKVTKIDTSVIRWSQNFRHATAFFKYCPVFELKGENIDLSNSDTYEVELAPLNPLPEGSSWENELGFDPEAIINIANAEEAKDVCNLKKLLRFNGGAPMKFQGPAYSPEENAKVSTNEPLPRFARLNFNETPVDTLPTVMLTSWLDARGIHVTSDDRQEIEKLVHSVDEMNTEVQEPELQPKDNPYHWFDVVEPTLVGNKYDKWCNDWIGVLPRLKHIDDSEFTRLFGKGVNGVRERAWGLVFDGNLLVSGIECINVASRNRNDTSKMILFRTRCCPSMKTNEGKKSKHLFYHIHICAEIGDEDGIGVLHPCPFSACSCENGCFICSHREALVIVISLAQEYLKKGRIDLFLKYFKAKEDPRLGQGKPVLIENYTLRAKSEHSDAKKKRKQSKGDTVTKTPGKGKRAKTSTVTP